VQSIGGVYAFCDVWDGVVHGDVRPWPPPELIQKLYQSRQARAYRGQHLKAATAGTGYYSDLQSVHSEDAVTWSLFGPLAYAAPAVRAEFAAQILGLTGVSDAGDRAAHIWLWRRLPHPDTLVPGGPEIDFGIQTAHTLVLGEAKWRSSVGTAQGVDGSKDQIELRAQFCRERGATLYPSVSQFVILGVSPKRSGLSERYANLNGESVVIRESTWRELGALSANPWRDEFLAQLDWRMARSSPTKGLPG
jgi:hypothetical protein